MDAETEKKELNILLMGKTGVGKSTFINAFTNYVSYDELDNVDEIQCPIPAKFNLYDDDGNLHQFEIGKEMNDDKNEGGNSTSFIASQTQAPKVYKFSTDEDMIINFIDTPGIGDTNGVRKDKENLERIINFMANFKSIHGFCLLLKPNETRLDAIFKYCILELLGYLDKSACNNIIFIFTNSRSTFYKPQATGLALKEILDGLKAVQSDVDIKFNKQTYYCMDSEAFTYLVADRYGISFTELESKMFADSWKQSRAECFRLLRYIDSLTPHKVQNTVSVSEARRLVLILSQPLADITKNITNNLAKCKKHTQEITEYSNDIEKLNSVLYVTRDNLVMDYFDQPRTVCSNHECQEKVFVNGECKINYIQICHKNCGLTETPRNIIGDINLKSCIAMYGENCYRCRNRCSYLKHLHIYYDTRVEQITVLDERTNSKLLTQKSAKERMEATLARLTKEIDEHRNEQNTISQASSKFAHFLMNRAIAAYNDAFQEYLEVLIENEKACAIEDGKSRDSIKELEKWRDKYKQEKKVLEKALKDAPKGTSIVTADMIIEEVEKLKNLPINGWIITDALEKQTHVRKQEQIDRSVSITPKNKEPGYFRRCINSFTDSASARVQKVKNFFHEG